MTAFWEGIVTIVTLILGIAFLAILLSPKSTTTAVGQTFFSGIGNTLGVAESPVTGANISYSTAYPATSSGYGFGS